MYNLLIFRCRQKVYTKEGDIVVNSFRLREMLHAHNMNLGNLADMLGISIQSVSRKIRFGFTHKEMKFIKDKFCLSDGLFCEIFFAKNVEEMSTQKG